MSKGEYVTLHMKSTTSFLVSKIVAQVLQSQKEFFFVIDEDNICDTLSLEMGKNCTCFESKFKSTTTITNHLQVKLDQLHY
jgi:hypothetical protein